MTSIVGLVKLPEPYVAPSSNFACVHKIGVRYGRLNGAQKPYTLLITCIWERRPKIDEQSSSFSVSSRKVASSERLLCPTKLYATLKSPKGFSPTPKKPKKTKKTNKDGRDGSDNEEDDQGEDPSAGVIPEVVTNRMMNRMAFSVGIPLSIGLLFFPLFYYLKVGLKIDVPNWVPFIVSFFFFGSALLGVSYGIVSSSWDPMREGSLLGWNEAKKNWPVFWQSLWGKSGKM
ncbi:hypothetical protein SAY87_014979 [Trapa incisa]|uniref:Protein PAM68, chloroplastic n=1 Tax=Trapa incisa TaxID=236973 RepID=A0AAN7GPD0_9MYRT|nr:hypothetical protein SAY87_014979 [Trapa incisa]